MNTRPVFDPITACAAIDGRDLEPDCWNPLWTKGYLFIWISLRCGGKDLLNCLRNSPFENTKCFTAKAGIYMPQDICKKNGKIAAEIHYRCCLKSRKGENPWCQGDSGHGRVNPSPFFRPLSLTGKNFLFSDSPASPNHPLFDRWSFSFHAKTWKYPTSAMRDAISRKRVHYPTIINGSGINGAIYHPGIIQDISLNGLCVCNSERRQPRNQFLRQGTLWHGLRSAGRKTSPFNVQCRPLHLVDRKNENPDWCYVFGWRWQKESITTTEIFELERM